MAIIVQNRFPIDFIDRKAIGVNIPFNAPAVFQSNYLTRDAIKNNLINFFLTNPGERVFNPFFGSGLNKLVNMNFLDTFDDEFVKKFLKDQIDQYFPFVGIEEINLVVNRESNQLGIVLKYQVENFGIQDEINITL
jgi:phage baseplate assembly protein W